MANINKIIKHNLQCEVDPLLEQGLPYERIADAIKANHPEIEDISKLSAMNVMRYKNDKAEKAMVTLIDEGKDPAEEFTKEYRAAIRKNNEEVQVIFNDCKKILEDAKLSDSVSDKAKAVEISLKSLDQIRKNWESLSQFGNRQIPLIGKVNLKKEQNIKVLILSVSNKLCPKCRDEIKNF
jgi:DNA-binding transcriptional regulator GbsR (MarR family)